MSKNNKNNWCYAPRLTKKQERFAQNIVDGMTQTAAYEDAYSAEGMSKNAIYVEASKLAKHPKVALRIQQLKDEYGLFRQTRRERTAELVTQKLLDAALNAKNDNARVRALELLGKTLGMFDRRQRQDVQETKSSNEILTELGTLLADVFPSLFPEQEPVKN